MIPKLLFMLLPLYFAVEIVCVSATVDATVTLSLVNAHTPVTPSPFSAVQTSSLLPANPSVASKTSSAAPVAAPSRSQTPPGVSPSLETDYVSSTSLVQVTASAVPTDQTSKSPTSTSPTSTSPTSTSPTSTSPTSTSPRPGGKGKTIGVLEIVGIVLLAILGILVIAFAIYYITCRKRMYPDDFHQLLVERQASPGPATVTQTKEPEIGIPHEAFVGDSDSPKEASTAKPEVKAQEPEVKVEEPETRAPEPEAKVQEPETKAPEVKLEDEESKEAEEGGDGTQDSAL